MSENDHKPTRSAGYRQPPEHTRYPKGVSGNPSGKRKGQPNVQDLMLREAARLVKVKTGEGVEKITKHEVVVRQLWSMAMKGDLPAARLILPFMEAARVSAADADSRDETGAISLPARPDNDAVRRMLARFAHLKSDES